VEVELPEETILYAKCGKAADLAGTHRHSRDDEYLHVCCLQFLQDKYGEIDATAQSERNAFQGITATLECCA